MVDFTPEQQAALGRIIGKKQDVPNLSFEQQAALDRVRTGAGKEVGWGEGAGRTVASGLTEGASALLGAPTSMFNLAQTGFSKLLGVEPTYAPDVQKKIEDTAANVTGGYTKYEPSTLVGKGVKNILTMAPTAAAAALTGGTSALPAALTYGAVVPGIAGTLAEPAGQAVGKALDDDPEKFGKAFKLAAEIASPSIASKFGPAMTTVLKNPQLEDVSKDLGKLEDFGIDTTAGSIRTSQEEAHKALLDEIKNPRTAAIIASQPRQFSNSILKNIGVDDDLARSLGYNAGVSPINVDRVVNDYRQQLGKQIGDTYNSISGVNINGITAMANSIPGFSKYQKGIDVGEWLHKVRQQANDILISARDSAGKSYQPAAQKLIDSIDIAFAKNLGPYQFAKLQGANAQFSRLKMIEAALQRAAQHNHAGLITPQDMLAVGGTRHTTDLDEMSALADKYLLAKNMIPNESNRRSIMKYFIDALGGAAASGIGALTYGADIGNLIKVGLYGLAGTAGTEIMQRALRAAKGSDFAQQLAKSKAMYAAPNAAIISAAPAVAGVSQQPAPYKRGGRVSNHDQAADQLVRAAERAKKGWNDATEPLLNQSDDAVAHALEVANRSI